MAYGPCGCDPKDYAVDLERTAFIDLMAEDVNAPFRGTWTIHDVCIRPEDAHDFCKTFRSEH
ncbi:MAG TPA: hypothetical protein VGP63_26480 [Planctomycetaceae bacterium]|nr:hypothetical protein [Planctomycetaceae bacterium]